MKSNHLSTAEVISKMKQAFSNAKNPRILAVLTPFGYTEEHLNSLLEQIEEILKLHENQISEYAEQHAKTKEFEELREQLDKIYKKDLAFARVFFKDNTQAFASLQLSGTRKRNIADWQLQVHNFYAQLLKQKELLEKMKIVGTNEEKIENFNNELKRLNVIREQQQTEMGEAQEATEKRDKAIDELYPKYSEMMELAKITLKDEQMLESLGIVVRRT